LGVNISSDLSLNNHINNITTKGNRTLGFLRRNIETRHTGIREMAYKTLVRPQVEYASTVWSPYTQQQIHQVEMVQRRAVRWVSNNYSAYESVSGMQEQLGWMSLHNRRADARLAMFYKVIHGLVAITPPPYLKHPSRITRHMHSLSYHQICIPVNYYKYSFFPASIILWNSLLSHIALPNNLEQFKQAVSGLHHYC